MCVYVLIGGDDLELLICYTDDSQITAELENKGRVLNESLFHGFSKCLNVYMQLYPPGFIHPVIQNGCTK